jgi:hypothetical protein
MFNILALNCCGLKNKLQYPEFQELLSANDIICSEFSFINFDDILHHNTNLFSVSITSISPSNFSL